MEQTLNLNTAECLHKVRNIGETVVMNVCSGKSVVLPWGALDWGAVFLVSLLVLLFITVFALMWKI